MMETEENYDEDFENEIVDCPSCGKTYSDADADFLICSHCGYNVQEKKYDTRSINKSKSRYGIDPDIELDDWR